MNIAVLANGVWDEHWGSKELKEVDYLVCADGGGNSAVSADRLPEVLIGDLDSVDPVFLERFRQEGVEIHQYPTEKDQTDLELALDWAVQKAKDAGEKEVLLLGAAGGRIDHFLGNVALLLGYAQKGYRVVLKDSLHKMWVANAKEIIPGKKGQEISLVALSESAAVTTQGLYYPLNHEELFQNSPRGISNVFLGDKVVVEIHQGWVLIILLNKLEDN